MPALSNQAGDFVFPNVTADTCSVEVTMDGCKTLRHKGVAVSGGDRRRRIGRGQNNT